MCSYGIKEKSKNSGSADLQMFLMMFLVLTIQGCDLLNLLPSSDRRELAGWESGRRRSVTFIFSRSARQPK